jgi:hypothetical protein
MKARDAAKRQAFLKEAVLSAGAALWSGTFFERFAAAQKKTPMESAPIGRRELVKGLDGMSRVAVPGNNPFTGGHTGAAVMSSAFFCREQIKDAPPKPPTPLVREYWVKQGRRAAGVIVSSHLIKYPYSFFALAKELRDDDLKQRLLDKIY